MPKRSYGSAKIFSPRFSREEVLSRLRERASELVARLDLERVVLFGSYAKGRYTPRSDIDVLFVHRGPSRGDAFRIVKDTLDLPGLEPHVLTEEEFARARGLWDRMLEGSVVIHGPSDPEV